MRVRFWGVRGASAATDVEFLNVGGNTPCVEVRDRAGQLLVFDAGIGLYWLGRSLIAGPHGKGKGEVALFLSHTHWDHIQGFPYFVPAFIPGNQLQIWGGGAELESILEGQMNPTYSPLASLSNMGSTITLHQLQAGEDVVIGALRVRHAPLRNGRHTVTGYRVEEGQRSLCYVCEVDHTAAGLEPAVIELARDVDLLIHESYHTNEEEAAGGTSLAGPWAPCASGHASFAQAVDAALAAGAKRLLFFYHHPDHTDAQIEAAVARERARLAALGSTLEIDTAREGTELQV